MQNPLAYTTTVMSWGFFLSSFERVKAAGTYESDLDLNLEAPSSVVLCAVSIEAFCNEISSLARAFVFDKEREQSLSKRQTPGIKREALDQLCALSQDGSGSFYDRYKRVLKLLEASNPALLENMVCLRDLRDALVHFRSCDVPIQEGEDGVIRYAQETPEVLRRLGNKDISERPVLAPDKGLEWTLRISTSAMSIWALKLTCDATLFLLDALPVGDFQNFVIEAYRPRDYTYRDLYSKAKEDIAFWECEIFS